MNLHVAAAPPAEAGPPVAAAPGVVGRGDQPGAEGRHAAPDGAGRLLDGVGGGVAAVIERVARWRGSKPMHPKGALLRARLDRAGGAASGVPWIDEPGHEDVVVRFSRGGGLPDGWPDVHGLAVRTSDGADLLLSTSGRAVGLRHGLALQRVVGHGSYTSIMPFRTERGPVMLAALPDPARELPTDPASLADELAARPWRLMLVWAPFLGAWRAFGSLEVAGRARDELDPPVRFEPLAPPAGLAVYPWIARLREPAYLAARRGFPTPTTPQP